MEICIKIWRKYAVTNFVIKYEKQKHHKENMSKQWFVTRGDIRGGVIPYNVKSTIILVAVFGNFAWQTNQSFI